MEIRTTEVSKNNKITKNKKLIIMEILNKLEKRKYGNKDDERSEQK